jgi:phage baseplate assembly protein W
MPSKEEEKMGKDLRLGFDELGADLTLTKKGDLSTVQDHENLAQAIIARLSTEEGELYDTGHPDYGSRLHEVIGEVNNEMTRRRIQAIVQDCLSQENRIKEVTSVNVLSDPNDHHKINIEITVLPQEGKEFLTLTYPFQLEG